MTDMAILAASAKSTLSDIAKQSSALGNGLLNAAPSDKAGTPNNSVRYLLTVSEVFAQSANECEKLLPDFMHHTESKPRLG